EVPSPAQFDAPVDVELKPVGGGSLRGHVKMAGAAPPKRLMVALDPDGERAMLEPSLFRFALTDEDGAFHLPHRAAGDYSYSVLTRFLFAEPTDFLPDRF